MKKIFFPIISCFMLLAIALNLSAMGGKRKGFVYGFGAGGGFTSYSSTSLHLIFFDSSPYYSEMTYSESSIAFAADFKIGYGATDQLVMLFTNKILWFSFKDDPVLSDGESTITSAHMVGMSYFFTPNTPSFFTSAGLGLSTWYPFLTSWDDSEVWLGLGLFAGLGYEFSPHWTIEVSGILGLGGSDDDYDAGKNPLSIMVTISWLGY